MVSCRLYTFLYLPDLFFSVLNALLKKKAVCYSVSIYSAVKDEGTTNV